MLKSSCQAPQNVTVFEDNLESSDENQVIGWALIQDHWCPYKLRRLGQGTEGRHRETTASRQVEERDFSPLGIIILDSSLQNLETINVCCWSPWCIALCYGSLANEYTSHLGLHGNPTLIRTQQDPQASRKTIWRSPKVLTQSDVNTGSRSSRSRMRDRMTG